MMFLHLADQTAARPLAQRLARSSVIRSALFLCCLTITNAAGQTPESADAPRKISGTVINAVTGAPIARALVISADNRYAMLTDGEGHFEFAVVPKGNPETSGGATFVSGSFRSGGCSFSPSWLHARKPGFLDDCSAPVATSDASADNLTIALVPEAIIHGRVTLGDSDDALSGTDVQLFSRVVADGLPRWVARNDARTNSAGEFRFAELPAGEYKLLTRERADDDPAEAIPGKVYGYPPVFYGGAADFASTETIHLPAGQTIEADFSAVRQPYYRVNIPISNDEIGPGMQVTVRSQEGPGYSLGYNQGAKRIEGFLPNGNYVIEATLYGSSAASGTVNVRVNGNAVNGPAMTLVPDTSIHLEVKEEFTDKNWSGEASFNDGKRTYKLHGPRVYLQASVESVDDLQQQRRGGMRQPAGANDESLVLENLPPGRYWLRLDTSRGYVASARMGDVDLLHEPLIVTQGVAAPIEIEMRDDTAEIDGTVTGIAPTPGGGGPQSAAPRAWIYCIPLADSPGQFRQIVASEDGQFSYEMMAPGAYRVLAFTSPQNQLPYRDAEAMKAYEMKGQVVHLSAGEKQSVQIPVIADSESLVSLEK